MSSGQTKNFVLVESITEQQENLKNSRKSFKVLQKMSTDKENLIGRQIISTKTPIKGFIKSKSETEINDGKIKRKKIVSKSPDPKLKELIKITEEDLTTEGEPSEGYWKLLAEKRREALETSLKENEELYDEVNSLRQQLDISHHMLEESKNLVDILTEMLQEDEDGGKNDDANQKPHCSKDLIHASLAEEAHEHLLTDEDDEFADDEDFGDDGKIINEDQNICNEKNEQLLQKNDVTTGIPAEKTPIKKLNTQQTSDTDEEN